MLFSVLLNIYVIFDLPDELLPETVTGRESSSWKEKEAVIYIIFIHALTNGLFRIKLQGQNAK